jgi:Domain of unknown function (DUF4178)
MKVAHCPACGGLVEFHVASSLVTICEHCHSAIARGDKALEDVGKVADLVDTQSPLRIGLQGNYRGKNYELVGRVQYQHPAGGVWDEWYMAFGGDRWGWLAEAQGRFYVTFEVPLRSSVGVPAFEQLEAGQSYNLGDKIGVLKVGEKNEAVAASAQGEIPWQFKPGAAVRFADLYGPESRFATLDYSDDAARIYVGVELALLDLGLPKSAFAEPPPPKEVKGLQLSCPKCGGALELHAPDAAQRIACPYCGSLLDVEQGNLKYLSTLRPSRIAPVIPLGTTGNLGETPYTVIGFMVRSVTEEGVVYRWQEYLLYNPSVGFRWLVHSDDHWNFVTPISPGEVDDRTSYSYYAGKSFRLFQTGLATVRHVLGEFYWKVEVGEEVMTRDLIHPPEALSIETAKGEQNVSLGIYIRPEEIEKAFGVRNLRRSWSVGMNQPAPPIGFLMLSWVAFAVFLVLIDVGLSSRKTPHVDQSFLFFALILISIIPIAALAYRGSFESRRWQNSNVRPPAARASFSFGGDSDD